MTESLERARKEATSLRLDCRKNVLDVARHLVEDYWNWVTVNSRDTVKRYEDTDVEIVVKLCILLCAEEYDLIFSTVPVGFLGNLETVTRNLCCDGRRGLERIEELGTILVSIGYFVQAPQKVISSFVSSEFAKQRVKFGNPTSAFEGILESGGTIRERKILSLNLPAKRNKSYSRHAMIQSGSEIGCGISNDLRKTRWELFCKYDLEIESRLSADYKTGTSINHSLIRATVEKRLEQVSRILNVFLSPSEFAPRAVKWLDHPVTQSAA